MKTSFNEKLIAYLTLLSGLAISAVAIYYSVSGLTAIFAGAVIPIIIMGVVLEVSKIIASIWLKQNWSSAPGLIKLYLSVAVALLMVITSTGIFGFLSQAHISQTAPSAEVAAKVAIIDEQIATQKENIEVARKSLAQMDATVDQTMSRSTNERGAAIAANMRRSQTKERAALQTDVSTAQKAIGALNVERAPIASNLRKVEAEVGPIKYIAAFFYGVTDTAVLEKAVTWVIILIIVVFDPLALILLIASQVSFQQFRARALMPAAVVTSVGPVLTPIQDNTDALIVDDPVIDAGPPLDSIIKEQVVAEIEPVIEETVDLTDEELSQIQHDAAHYGEPDLTATQMESLESTIATEEEFFAHGKEIAQLADQAAVVEAVPNYTPAWPPLNYVEVADIVPEVLTQVYPRIAPIPSDSYVQNEEQTESNLWSTTSTAAPVVISHNEYMQASQEKLEEYITEMATLVRAGKMQMTDVPEALLAEVKTRV